MLTNDSQKNFVCGKSNNFYFANIHIEAVYVNE